MCDFYGGDFGGAGGCYNTPMNTMGLGDVVPAGTTEYGNDFKQMQFGKPATKKPAQYQNPKKNQMKVRNSNLIKIKIKRKLKFKDK